MNKNSRLSNKRVKRFVISVQDLTTAGDFVSQLLKYRYHDPDYYENIEEFSNSDEFRNMQALTIAVIVSYSRPFTENKGKETAISSLPTNCLKLFDASQTELHRKILTMRNKAVSHSDADLYEVGLSTSEDGRPTGTYVDKAPRDIYIGVASCQKKGGKKEDIIEIPAVWVDIDFKDIEADEAKKRINEFQLKPSIVVESGGGLHLYWLLESPAGISDVAKIESINKRLAIQLHGDQASSDAAHILRLPGTYNHKYTPIRHVIISSMNKDIVYKLADFDFLPEPPNPSQTMPTGTSSEWCEDALKGVSHGKRHDSTVALAGLCLQKKVTENDAKELLAIWNLKNNPPDSEKELLETITDVYKRYGQSESSEGSSSATTSSDYSQVIEESIMSVADFMKKQITPKTYIVDPWLKQGDLALISAHRGVGKTWLALSVAKTATRDFSFGKWKNGTLTGCLYIDGEMAEYELQERLIDLHMESPKAEATFKLISADNMRSLDRAVPNLINQRWRESISTYLKNHPDIQLLIIDNLASLTPGLDENVKKDWNPINQWLLKLRSSGIAVIMVHHTGKDGHQRGTSAREDNLNSPE